MNLKDTVLSEKHQQQKCCMILFYEVHRVGRFIEAEKNGGCRGLVFNGDSFSWGQRRSAVGRWW